MGLGQWRRAWSLIQRMTLGAETPNRLPIAFELTVCEPQRLVFENPSHDFPKRLEYVATSADAMKVAVTDGKEKGFTLSFTRK